MEITTELLQIIYQRALQFAITRFGSEPDRLELDGESIKAVWEHYRCGDVDVETEYISAENLTEDLDAVYQKRLQEEEERRIAAQKKRLQEEEDRRVREKQQRYANYLELRKEFE
jgi:hypothetical protein